MEHPIAGYQISPLRREDDLGEDPSRPGVHRVMLTTQIWWVRADVSSEHQTEEFEFRDGASYQSRTLKYELWLDSPPQFDGSGSLQSSGNVLLERTATDVVAGVWRNGNANLAHSHPDYLWIVKDLAPSSGFTNPFVNIDWVKNLVSSRE